MEDTNRNPGIDTEEERQRITYRPEKYERTNTKGGRVSTPEAEEVVILPEDEFELPVTRLDQNLAALEQMLEDLEGRLDKANRDKVVPVPSYMKEKVQGDITFDRYKLSLKGGSLEDELVRQAWEEYAEDIEGDLEMELYEDVYEIKEDLAAFLPFVDDHIYAATGLERGNVDTEKEKRFEKEARLFEEETRKMERERKLAIMEHDLEALSRIEDGIRSLRKEKARIDETLLVKEEALDITEEKLSRQFETLEEIEEMLEDTYEDGSAYISERIAAAEDEPAHRYEMRGARTLLKLAVDQEIEEKAKEKRYARTHLSLEKRKRLQSFVQDSLYLQKHLNSTYKQILLDGDEQHDAVLEKLVKGSAHIQRETETRMLTFYRANVDEAVHRMKKIKVVKDKETTRKMYHSVAKRLDEIGGNA